MVRRAKQIHAKRGRPPVKIAPIRALAEVRKTIPGPTRIEEEGRVYRRGRHRRVTREIIADDTAGC
jgi:hypothetical protein